MWRTGGGSRGSGVDIGGSCESEGKRVVSRESKVGGLNLESGSGVRSRESMFEGRLEVRS